MSLCLIGFSFCPCKFIPGIGVGVGKVCSSWGTCLYGARRDLLRCSQPAPPSHCSSVVSNLTGATPNPDTLEVTSRQRAWKFIAGGAELLCTLSYRQNPRHCTTANTSERMASTTELTQSDDHPPHLDPSELGTKQ
ncbi:hypothetical protein CIHG_05343 [Coccidioides immitis H538.4]|uniref:Uncharacterized protein n=2 Tax=Coccidioides immitis TaxID=5501 RepID=A0A0J8RTS9_COCIT|nr:hypothetical protein CIRG_02124 [Coccidioides immitis RMSCC 2394]KMU88172.1 hypothetical protein CIHG_05343 [Coccidioides immitis H538.4]